MQDVSQNPVPDPQSDTTQDPGLHEPGMDAMSAAAGNPSSDAGSDPKNNTGATKDEGEQGNE